MGRYTISRFRHWIVFNNNVEAKEDYHVCNKGGRGNHLKVLAAKKVLGTQKKEGVSFAMKEGGIIDKLDDLEDKAVKLKASKEVDRVV